MIYLIYLYQIYLSDLLIVSDANTIAITATVTATATGTTKVIITRTITVSVTIQRCTR